MFHVKNMKAVDFPFAVELANTMNWNMAQEDFEFNLKLEPGGCFVLFDGSSRVGVATCISFGKVGWFGNLVMIKSCRNRGGGTLLVQEAVRYLKKANVETIGLYAYPHLIGFYEEVGFKTNSNFSVLQGKVSAQYTQSKLREIDKNLVPALMEFDRGCFNWNRRKLLEPIFLDEENRCYVSTYGGRIVGYVTAKTYDGMAEVGPLLCRRDSSDVTVSLLETVLGKLSGREVFVCLPTAEESLVKILREKGLQESFRLTRMFLGPAIAENCTYIAESLERG